MAPNNLTSEPYLLLMVFSDLPWMKAVHTVVLLNIYLVTILWNLLLLLLRRIDPSLHTPMYFFLSHLSFIDICFTTTIVPKMLSNYLTEDKSISYLACATQMYFSLALGCTECLLLAIMAYDRHVAICQPLHYNVIMCTRTCFLLAALCWTSSLVNSLFHTVFTFFWSFCKSKEIKHFVCEIQPLLRLSCADTHTHEMWVFVSATIIVLCAFLFTLFSYIHIISTIMKIHSSEGKSRVFSTCSSHLLVVIIFYGTISSIYLRPISSYNPERDRVLTLLYTVVTPMCNPLIYTMRNKEVKGAMRKAMMKRFKTLSQNMT
ncbi:putative olfactory receptor 2B8 [Ambystoma mexicanum]|uniref:putative olfactory receptor 2B8 n=1 Tax=Ambystoma mexicanum TaxID=8296 RepID=UPI0037E8D140